MLRNVGLRHTCGVERRFSGMVMGRCGARSDSLMDESIKTKKNGQTVDGSMEAKLKA